MKPNININWQQKAKLLEKKLGSVREAAYQCGIAEHTCKRIMKGETKKVEHDCGVLMLWNLEN